MPRNIFEKMKRTEEENDEKKEYTPPEEKLFDTGLVSKLVEHYIEERDNDQLRIGFMSDFESEVNTLESIIENAEDKLNPQVLIDLLTIMLKDETDRDKGHYTYPPGYFTRVQYLTAVIQALFNLDYENEFIINISNWPTDVYYVGKFLRGRPDKPLTLNLYGYFNCCGNEAEHCNFIVHDNVDWCGFKARYSNFTFHGKVQGCGFAQHCNFIYHNKVSWSGSDAEYSSFTFHDTIDFCAHNAKHCEFTFHDTANWLGQEAEDCTFNLMPNAKIGKYVASPLMGNVLRRMKEKSEWEILSPMWLRVYHKVKSIFK